MVPRGTHIRGSWRLLHLRLSDPHSRDAATFTGRLCFSARPRHQARQNNNGSGWIYIPPTAARLPGCHDSLLALLRPARNVKLPRLLQRFPTGFGVRGAFDTCIKKQVGVSVQQFLPLWASATGAAGL